MLNFGKGITDLIKKVLTRSSIDREAIEEIVKGLQRILLQADVDVKLVYDLSNTIRKRCIQEKISTGLTIREHVMKVVYEEITNLLGKEKTELLGKKRIMMVGLFGSGKTTTTAKLAKFFQKQGLKPAMIACDYHRPAAPQQLQQLGDKLHVPVHINDDRNPYNAVKEGLGKFEKYDVVIVDTAGRNALDNELAEELKELYKIFQPSETLLVIPADLGRTVGKQAEEFHKLVGITGVIVTKTDGTAKGGGALSSCSITKAKVKFIGTGEKIEDLESYDPVRFVSRLLGMGDLQALIEKVKDAEFKEEDAEKLLSGKFTLKDFYDQLVGMEKMGPLSGVMEMIPGLGHNVPENLMQLQETKMKKFKYIIDSMTHEEKENPEIIHASRIKRIAKGSGTSDKDVRDLLKQFEQSKKLIKKIGGMGGLKRGQLAKLAKKFGLKI
ncbi:MAG: signal recognition particle receptor subunit alpha [Candidatus Aenigmarchaeota archaeon]|nr:signal recognition particle receptor subunit alpha [Candidatus Aenigmarchaeota archaeon]